MGLNVSKGNMYEFVTHTWNAVKGECYHGCGYCYMHRWGKQKPVRFDEKEMKTDLGTDNFIFVGSSCDMWSDNIPEEWIIKTIEKCDQYPDNGYLFQTKNPHRIRRILPYNSKVCITLETNRHYPDVMKNSPSPKTRVAEASLIRDPLYVTIEPVIDFDSDKFYDMIYRLDPIQVNVGADSGKNNLPEPDKFKLNTFIAKLEKITTVHLKPNLRRLL